jgi:hypothetical protein
MRNLSICAVLIVGLFFPIAGIHAQTANTITATCKDGTTFSGTKKAGACRGHGGVQSWGTTPAATGDTAAAPSATAPATTGTTKAGPGQVWVNTASKVYHCPGTRWYGKTKQGSYMSEADAKAQGDRPDHGKACGS